MALPRGWLPTEVGGRDDSDEALDPARESAVEGQERDVEELCERDVLGIVGFRPSER